MKFSIPLSVLFFVIFGCKHTAPVHGSSQISKNIFEGNNLTISALTDHVMVHTSYLNTQDFGKVPCNGMVYINDDQAIIADTPVDSLASEELIHFVEQQLHKTIKAVVVTHFHTDCLGGLAAFHQKSIPSYAYELTAQLAEANQYTKPQHTFKENTFELMLGDKKIVNFFAGAGHTKDNIVCYIPDEKTLFGGCLIKTLDADKGNLEDADTLAWSHTIRTLQTRYPNIQWVIPGHGKAGNSSLLDYTAELLH